ncbi:hypothetical protein WJX72_011942 [[Myrmecia] bisecta]|uniref:Uncharacterized protein n=1 Tax=[Myrmecia] bisecta TaxID=41462 RepID=A0AAW1PPG3_9CHLO
MPQPKVSIVTGANAGLGKEVTAGLMAEGHHVIMACRNLQKCRTRQRLKGRALAVLVNNAGIMGAATSSSTDDNHVRVNHMGPFLLTRLLLPFMGAGSRIVTVASRAHMQGSLHIADGRIQGKPSFWYLQYARSKLCNVLFTAELLRRLEANHSPITAYSVSPGRVATNIYDNMPAWQRCFVKPLANWFFQTPRQGAATVLYACLASELEGRNVLYLKDCKEAPASATARDADLAKSLWQVSSQEVGMPED